jgi:uncharacterized protein YukE
MQPPPPQYLYRDVSFHPPEADRLAEKIAEKIRHIGLEKIQIDSSINALDSNWEGRQKDGFLSAVAPHRKKTAAQIEYLQQQELFFRNLKVIRREPYLNPDWEAYQKRGG